MEFFIDLHRFDEKISQLESHPVTNGKVMLYGSSFFAHWFYDRAKDQLKAATGGKLDIINHGFGGATADELLYYYNRLVKPYGPSAMVIRAGYNELNRGQSPENAVFLLERLLQWSAADNPDIKFLVLKIFDTRHAGEELYKKITAYNTLLEKQIACLENVTLLDLNPFFYAHPGDIGDRKLLRDVFVSDGLHLTDAAYEEMADFLGNLILNTLEG